MKNPSGQGRRSDKSSKGAAEPRKLAPSSATGGKGYRFENRVQATKLLALCIAGPTAGLPDESRVVELRFQARVHGRFTDDLVCTVENTAGLRSRALMQMKSGLTARKSDKDFVQAIGNAWLDFHSQDFAKGSDTLLIVHDALTKSQMSGAQAVVEVAKSSLTSTDWQQKLIAPGAGNETKRSALATMKGAVELYAKRDCTLEELFTFLTHVHFIAHDLDSDVTPECKSYLQQIQTAAPGHPKRLNPPLVWSKMVTICMELNELAGAIDLANLKDFLGDELSAWFAVHRSFYSAASQAISPVHVGPHLVSSSTLAASTVMAMTSAHAPVAQRIQEQLPTARDSSVNKYLSGQLDHINGKIKALQYTAALSDIEHLGQDMTLFDAHQKARWHLLRGVCYWHLHGEAEAAVEFLKAADLCEDDDKLAASRARAHLMRKEVPEAIAAARSALDRFPNSLSAWLALANARMMDGETLSETDIPPIHRHHADPLQMVAWSLKAHDKVREAAKTALRALTLQDAGFFLADTCLAITLENAAGDGLFAAFRLFDSELRSDLATAVAAFEPRSQKLWLVQAPDAVAEAASRLGMAYLLLGRHDDALAIYQESQVRGIVAPVLYRFCLEALAASGKQQEALVLGRKVVNDMPPEALVAFGQLACEAGQIEDLDQALRAAQERALDQRAVNALKAQRWDLMLASSETRATALSEIREQLATVIAGTAMSLLAISGRALKVYGNPGEVTPVIQRATDLITNDSQAGDIYLASMLLLQVKRYDRAAELLARILPAGQRSELHTYRLHALLRSGQLAKARELVKSFPAEWTLDDETRYMAIELGQRAADWDLLATLVQPQIEQHPDAAVSWIFRFLVAAHQDEASLRAIVGDAPELASGSIQEITRLASFEMSYGDRNKAMRRLYRMRRSRLDDAEAAAAHLAAHLLPGGELPLLRTMSDTVEPGTSVLLRDAEGRELLRTIDPSECEVLPLTEEFRHSSSDDAHRLLGLRVGDTLTVPDQLISRTRTFHVGAIQSAYKRLLDLSGQTTSQSLNPSKFITMMAIDEDSEGKSDFSELTRQLKEQADHAREVFDIYRTSPITLGCLAKMLGLGSVDLTRAWQQQEVALFVGGGVPQERDVVAQLLSDPASTFVIDAATLAELATIDCLDCLATVPLVLVTTRTRDLIYQKLADVAKSRRQGTAFQREGQLGFEEFTERDRVQEIKYFETIKASIERHCKVLPAYGPEDMSKVPAELRRLLSGEEFATVMLCLQENAHLLSLDGRLRTLAALLGTHGAWPQALLTHALARHAIGQRDYSVACLKMYFANRTFISLGDFDLVTMVHQGENWLEFGIRKFAKQIAESDIEFESAVRVSMEFLGKLFRIGNCQFGVICQLLDVLVSALKKHKQCGKDLEADIVERLTSSLGSFGERQAEYVRLAVAAMFVAGSKSQADVPLQVSVLKIASPPLVHVRKKVRDAPAIDKELSKWSADAATLPGGMIARGTSEAADT
jgi:tetratricopeptide (TPR) repeat protein